MVDEYASPWIDWTRNHIDLLNQFRLDMFLKCRSDKFRHILLENLYWTGRKVVGVMFRKKPSAKEPTNLDALKDTLIEMFDGTLPTCLEELQTQIDKKSLPLQYLLDDHYFKMRSQERISYQIYVVRNILKGSVRSGNIDDLGKYWENDPICQLVQPVAWKNSLRGTYGSNAKRWNRQPEDPIQYFIMVRNIREHNSYQLSASKIDEDVIDTYPGHADAILVCIYALHLQLNFVKLKGLK